MKSYILTSLILLLSSAQTMAFECDKITTRDEYKSTYFQLIDSHFNETSKMAKEIARSEVAADDLSLNEIERIEAAAKSMELRQDLRKKDRDYFQIILALKKCAKDKGLIK